MYSVNDGFCLEIFSKDNCTEKEKPITNAVIGLIYLGFQFNYLPLAFTKLAKSSLNAF